MPINIDDELINELVKRQVAEQQTRKRVDTQPEDTPHQQTTLSPTAASIIGALADGASTYSFLKRGTGVEDNAMFGGLKGKPLATALSAAGTGLAAPLLGKLLKGKLPKGVIDALVANMGARTLATAGANFDGLEGESSFDQVTKALTQPTLRHR